MELLKSHPIFLPRLISAVWGACPLQLVPPLAAISQPFRGPTPLLRDRGSSRDSKVSFFGGKGRSSPFIHIVPAAVFALSSPLARLLDLLETSRSIRAKIRPERCDVPLDEDSRSDASDDAPSSCGWRGLGANITCE